ncbi:hypothetical protein C8R45DRAFT_941786 [Mycena sanguinolenta]|nr:hypothetical protein C8R45DRAFT_941786 [Mycena sanguinolenta]
MMERSANHHQPMATNSRWCPAAAATGFASGGYIALVFYVQVPGQRQSNNIAVQWWFPFLSQDWPSSLDGLSDRRPRSVRVRILSSEDVDPINIINIRTRTRASRIWHRCRRREFEEKDDKHGVCEGLAPLLKERPRMAEETASSPLRRDLPLWPSCGRGGAIPKRRPSASNEKAGTSGQLDTGENCSWSKRGHK